MLQRAGSNSCILPDLDFTLRRQFNKPSFRPQQREIIEAALAGRDVFVQAATSFGKSLCYQLPAIVDQGSAWTAPPLPINRESVTHYLTASL
jgi:superfamily II DNA helicase RecQ